MIIERMEQQSEEWFAARCGVPSASNFDKIITTKGEPSKQAEKYLYQLAGERITGKKEEGYTNQHMLRGNELEAEARELYELITDSEVEQVGICYADENKRYSCSPDGLMLAGRKGLEIKCPTLAVHVAYLLGNKLPSDYFQQVHGSLFVCRDEVDDWDFMSYYPGMPPLIVTVHPMLEWHKKLEQELDDFCRKLEQIENKLKEIR